MTKKLLLLPLIFLTFIFTKNTVAQDQNQQKRCAPDSLQASFELENDWIYICSESEGLFLIKEDKQDQNPVLKIPASGGFPTYAAVEGDLYEPDSNIYNISPFYFQIIQANIITEIKPVLRTFEHNLSVEITPLVDEEKKASLAICNPNKPVQVFETDTSNIYICIETPENDRNSINLTYIKTLKSNPNSTIKLKAQLISSFHYKTSTQKNIHYIISYKGLETYKNGQKINTEPVNHVYLIPSDNSL